MRSSNLRLSARLALLALVVLVASACVHRPQRADVGAFVARELQVDGATQRYQVFVPSRQAGGRHPPVVMFLHGSGERGSDNQRQTEVGLGPHIRRNRTTYPAIAVFPQIRQGESWNGANARMAMAMLDASVREFDGDDDRIVLTGISRGGYGVYELALLAPQRFTALVPVCGGITQPPALAEHLQVEGVTMAPDPFAAAAQRLQHLPMWVFHGADDAVITPDQSRHMVEALRRIGGEVRYSEFAGVGHDAWDRAYATPELWGWAFALKR